MRKIENKSDTMLGIEERFGENLEELLRRMYVDEGKTTRQIAQILSITKVSIIRWLDKAGIYSHKLNIKGY